MTWQNSSADIADTLRGAALYIEQHGWTQHLTLNRGGEVCARGAILGATSLLHTCVIFYDNTDTCLPCDLVENDHDEYLRLERLGLETVKAFSVVTGIPTITLWNDTCAQTAEVVVETFRDAANKIEDRG